MKASVYIVTSVDGFIARENGSVDWLSSGEDAGGEDYGFQVFINSERWVIRPVSCNFQIAASKDNAVYPL